MNFASSKSKEVLHHLIVTYTAKIHESLLDSYNLSCANLHDNIFLGFPASSFFVVIAYLHDCKDKAVYNTLPGSKSPFCL